MPPQDVLECIEDCREHDVPYHWRYAIDADVRCAQWYMVRARVRHTCTLVCILFVSCFTSYMFNALICSAYRTFQ